ncbi:hypothetical protein ACLB1R_09725 [Escherichia coli]
MSATEEAHSVMEKPASGRLASPRGQCVEGEYVYTTIGVAGVGNLNISDGGKFVSQNITFLGDKRSGIVISTLWMRHRRLILWQLCW